MAMDVYRRRSIDHRLCGGHAELCFAHRAAHVLIHGKRRKIRLSNRTPDDSSHLWRRRGGGSRVRFTISGVPCERRVRKLLLPPGGKYFGCRNCYRLTYLSRKEDAKTRALTTTQRIRVRLGGDASLASLFPPKPKGMWNRTYARLRLKAEEAEVRGWRLALMRFGELFTSYGAAYERCRRSGGAQGSG